MIALYSDDAQQAASLSPLVGRTGSVVPCADWSSLQRARSRARCSVLCVARLQRSPVFAEFVDAARHPGVHPTVLVTDRDPDNLRLIRGVAVEEVVWPEEVGDALLPAIQRACSTGYLLRVAAAVESSPRLPLRLRAGLAHTCRSRLPVGSVKGLAAVLGVDRSTLCRQWLRGRREGTALRLEDFLDWLILLRAVGRRAPGRKWSAVAAELGVPERTLARTASRLLQQRLRELDCEHHECVVARFEADALAAVVQRNV